MQRALSAGAGFLLAVLWFDLMFDVQALAQPDGEVLPEAVLASMAHYYRRVTTEAGMSFLVGLVMLSTIGGAAWQVRHGAGPPWLRWVALALCSLPIALALAWILPDAARLGARSDSLAVQSALARRIGVFHVAAFASMAGFLALQLFGPRAPEKR